MLPDMLKNSLDVAVVCEVDPVVEVFRLIVMSTVV
jgi:hypothetical protein